MLNSRSNRGLFEVNSWSIWGKFCINLCLFDVILFLFIKLSNYSKQIYKISCLKYTIAIRLYSVSFHQPQASHNKSLMLETWHYWEVVTDDNFPRLNCPIVREDDWFTSQPIEPTEKFLSWKSSHVGKVPMLEKFLCWKSFNNGKV